MATSHSKKSFIGKGGIAEKGEGRGKINITPGGEL
jgi:hypothetical protein